MVAKRGKKTGRKAKTLSVKAASPKRAGAVRGGALTIKQKVAEEAGWIERDFNFQKI